MTDRFITVVFRIKPEDQTTLVQLENHPKAVAFSMGDHLKERYFCQRCGKRVQFDQDVCIRVHLRLIHGQIGVLHDPIHSIHDAVDDRRRY